MRYLLVLLFIGAAWSAPKYSRSLTVTSNSALLTATLTNFPVLVSISSTTAFKTIGNGGNVQNSNGYDITFASDSAGATPLSWEMEFYDGTVGTVVAWVKVPSCALGTVFYMFYGDPTISTFQSTATAVWDSNFKAVYHLSNGTTLSVTDSTGTTTGTNHSATATTGQIDGAMNIVSASLQYADAGTALNPTTALTACAWVNPSSTTATRYVVAKTDNTNTVNLWELRLASAGTNVRMAVSLDDSTLKLANVSGYTASWQWVCGTFDGSTVKAWRNATAGTGTAASGSIPSQTGETDIGRDAANANSYFNGPIDEVRVSNVDRSATAGWMTADYNTQLAPNTFLSVGSEVATPTNRAVRVIGGGL